MSKLTESAEDRLIARYFRPLATAPGALGLVDDAAALTPPPGCDLVLTTDGVIAGVHFFPDDPPDMVARKALRMNLSDLAAKGAKPLGFLLSVALPDGGGRDLDQRLCQRPRRRRGALWLSVVRRRHRPHARSGLCLDRRLRRSYRTAKWCGARRPGPATASSSPAPSATRRSG